MTPHTVESEAPRTLLGVPYWTRGREELEAMLRNTEELVELNGVNAEVSVQALDNFEHFSLLARNPTNLIDGQGVCRLLQWKYGERFDRISGSDFTADLASIAHEKGWRVFLLGGCEEASAGTREHLLQRFPGMEIECFSPPMETGQDFTAEVELDIAERLDAFGPHLLIGCFGAPKQEFWFSRHRSWLEARGVRVWMGAGGTFDFLSGRVRRAPRWVSNAGMEWCWRLVQEPSARLGRVSSRLPRFAVLGGMEALRYRLGGTEQPTAGRPYARWGTRIFSLVAVLLGLPLALGLGLAVALANAIAFRDPRKVFFSQPRVGHNGKVFTLHKFRTMTRCADSFGSWSSGDDAQRVTRLGRVLRCSHLDELPQLWNVLRGDMNLVGPRPEMVEVHRWAQGEVPGFARRLGVRPGITGRAQVTQGYTGRHARSYARKLHIDETYIQDQSLLTDLRICLATVRWMLLGRGWGWRRSQDAEAPKGDD